MLEQRRRRWQLSLLFTVAAVSLGILLPAMLNARSNLAAHQPPKPLDKPPEGQTFLGIKTCASCHLDQFLVWKESKHAKGFEVLPAKYKEDASCLKCHSTGFGQPTGFKSLDATPQLAGTACEMCHGPGSKHVEIAKTFGEKKLSKEEQDYVRSTIWKMEPKNVCVECHLAQSHKKHPPYDKE